jgi:hypothetical protein
MDNSHPKINCFSLGKKDKITKYQSKWPIYELDVYDKNGLWNKFRTHLNSLEDKKELKKISIDEIDDFYNKSPDIDFEIKFFANLMNKNYIFKFNNILYSYTIGYKTKLKKKMYVRFYFDLKSFLSF